MKKLLFIFIFFAPLLIFSQTLQFSPLPACWQKSENGKSAKINLNHKVVLFNKSETTEDYILRIFNSEGVKIGYKTGTLNPFQKEEVEINSLVEEGKTPASVKVIGNNIVFIIVSNDNNGERLTAFWLPDVGARQTMWINHLAPEREQFFTSLSVSAFTDCNLTWNDANTVEDLGLLNEEKTMTFELASIYPSNIPQEVSMANIETGENQNAIGIECFGNWDDKITFATLPATWFSNTRLIFPHIAYSKTLYWTGLIIGNPNNEEANIKIRFMGEDGSVIQTQHTKIPSLNRIVMLFAHQNTSNPPLPEDIPEGTAWLDVYSDKPLTGFELFGGNDTTKADYMEGIRATCEPFEKGVAPYIIDSSNRWTGIAIVNSLSIPVSANLKLLSPSGEVVETKTLDFNPFEKKVDLLRNIFDRSNVALEGSLIIEPSVKGALTGIIVFGDDNVTPRKILGGYEIIPLNENRMYGPYRGEISLPRFGINSPKFPGGADQHVTTPSQEDVENEIAWVSSGQPYRFALRHLQSRDVFYSEWIDENNTENREEFLRNSQGFSVMPTIVGFKPYWTGIDDDESIPIDMNSPDDVQKLKDYVTDVVTTFPELKYYEILNETFGEETYGEENFAKIIDTTVDTAKSIDPDIKFSFPHLLGTLDSILVNQLNKLVAFAHNYPETMAKIDVYGIHYYGPWQNYADIVRDYLLSPMDEGMLPEKPWVISETGISTKTDIHTVTNENGIEPGLKNQASYMVKMFTISFALGAETCLVHSFQSGSTGGGWAGYGIIDDDTKRKPSICALRMFADSVRDFTFVDTLKEGEDGIWLYRFNNAQRLKGDAYIAWKDDGVSASDSTITLPSLAGEYVEIVELVPEDCPGYAGDMAQFNPDDIFNIETGFVDDNGNITVNFGEYPVLIRASEKRDTTKIYINSSNSFGTIQNLLGVIAGPYTPPQTPFYDLTEKLQDIGVTTIRNNGYYDDSLDIEGIFQCPDDSVYPSWDCDANNDSYYHWDASDRTYSSIVDGGFEPFLRVGGETQSYYKHHDFAGPREDQEDNWIIAAKKMVDRYKNWNSHPNAFPYLDIWTEWPNSNFFDRTDSEFLTFWVKVFKELKSDYPELKVGGPGILKPTIDVINGVTENNKAIMFLLKLYNENVKPDWIGFHMWKSDPCLYYKAVKQYRDLLDGKGDFSSVPWAGTGFFDGVEIICDAYGYGKDYDAEDGSGPIPYSNEYLFNVMNGKQGAAMLCADFIALQQGGVVRAYYYRSSDERSTSPDAGPNDENRGWTGLFYGDENATPKPSSNAFRLYSMLYRNYPKVLTDRFFTVGERGRKLYYIASKGESGIAILISNVEDIPIDTDIYLDGKRLTENSEGKIKIYRVNNTNNGGSPFEWQGHTFRIPPECTEVIVIDN
ncbi:hypothetical protein TTHT_0459 [Thermotomaculum hydrothermale]|uniref:Asl1-like glycosyl hydrolase catalytic domain-containing protein n=1 Tax=Thermotomaculum hydrothermale TaxID=981385 RepID=A0A7R6PPM5_9BACT|nr:hypothetical protein [Thermotomaculum hydrothermale]BBB32051.1 hypothetical protein TTHT_0459 [Thermotomaculum hydrothermale]